MTHPQMTTYRVRPAHRHIERLADEVLVYAVASDQVHRLGVEAAAVWDACAEGATTQAVVAATALPPAQVDEALAQLVAAGLVDAVGPDGLTRRQFAARVGAGAAAVVGLGLVTTIAAPTPAAAASGPGGGGGSSGGGCEGPECGG